MQSFELLMSTDEISSFKEAVEVYKDFAFYRSERVADWSPLFSYVTVEVDAATTLYNIGCTHNAKQIHVKA